MQISGQEISEAGLCCTSEYGKLCCDVKEDVSYSYTLQTLEELHTPYFHIGKEGKASEALTA